MSVISDNYLYNDYCAAVMPPPMAYGRARQLATRVGVPENVDVCDGLQQKLCRVSLEDGDMICPNALAYDNLVVKCGTETSCVSAEQIMQNWKRNPKQRERFSPRDRHIVQQTYKKRGTPKARANLTCVERRGNSNLCESNSLCQTEYLGWLAQSTDCKVKLPPQTCHAEHSKFLLLDAVLRTMDAVSGNMRKRIERNIDNLPDTDVCAALAGFYPSFRTRISTNNQLNKLATSILGESDALDNDTLQDIANEAGIEMTGKTASLLTSAFNAASAALAIQAPWWFYFVIYPSGRDALRNVLSDSISGKIFKLSLLLTGMKGNWIFDDQMGLLDHVNVLNSHPLIKSVASTLTGVLLRQMSSNLKQKGY